MECQHHELASTLIATFLVPVSQIGCQAWVCIIPVFAAANDACLALHCIALLCIALSAVCHCLLLQAFAERVEPLAFANGLRAHKSADWGPSGCSSHWFTLPPYLFGPPY